MNQNQQPNRNLNFRRLVSKPKVIELMNLRQTSHEFLFTFLLAVGVIVLLAPAVVCLGISQTQDAKIQDGPVSVTHESLYRRGKLKIEPHDLRDLPPLPRNYQALQNRGYLIHHSGLVAGPHIVRFVANTVTDEKEFNNLRIFHAQPDRFDPQMPAWADVTQLSSTDDKHDFMKKTLVAKTADLGIYVIAKLVGDPTKNPKADLAVSFSNVLGSVRSPNPVPFTIKIVNNGPDVATNVGLRSPQPNHSILVRVEPTHGKCKEWMGSIYCKLGNLKPGEIAGVSFVVTPDEGALSFPEDGEDMVTSAYAASDETDPNTDDNVAEASTVALPNLNKAPRIEIETPVSGAVYVGPTDITLKAKAEDPDGTISKVEFFDNDQLIGSGTRLDQKTFVIKKSNVSYGIHVFEAVAIDNQGRENSALAGGILVNGLATIEIVSPKAGGLFASGADLNLVARVKHPSANVMKVEFIDQDGKVIGEGIRNSQDEYTFVWKNIEEGLYLLEVVATDTAGIPTRSQPVEFTVRPVERPKP